MLAQKKMQEFETIALFFFVPEQCLPVSLLLRVYVIIGLQDSPQVN
jgi:hypothetical protein